MSPNFAAIARAAVEAGIGEYRANLSAQTPPVHGDVHERDAILARHVEKALRQVHAEALASPLPAPMSAEELSRLEQELELVGGVIGDTTTAVYHLLDHIRVLTAYLRDVEEAGEFGAGVREGKRAARAEIFVTNQPTQPIEMADDGVVRFHKNAIVEYLCDWAGARGMSMNKLAVMTFSNEDRMQFAQLIGYSVSGFGDLSYANSEVVQQADELATEVVAQHSSSRSA